MQQDRVVIVAPREHAKSSWFSLIYPLYCILFKKKNFIVLISDTATQAQEQLGTIVEELETNELITEDFGHIAGYTPQEAAQKQKWTASDIVTTTGVKVVARGWKSKLRGIKKGATRPDLIVVDDIENDENVQSEEQRKKLQNVFYKSILNLGSKDTQIIMVGTILHFDSLLNNLILTPPPHWKTRFYKAIEDNEPIWPEWWTLQRLEEKKAEIGSIPFEQEFMNNPLDPSVQIIKPQEYYEHYDPTMHTHYGFIDLAISEKETADYTAIVTIAKEIQTGKLKIIDPVRIRGDITAQLDLVFLQHNKYNYVKFGVESVAYQKAFHQILMKESQRRGIYIPAIEVEVDKDKVRRAIEVTPHIENGTVQFNKSHQDFLAEIVQFPKGAHDDFVDALVGAIKMAVVSSTGKVKSGSYNLYKGNY